VASFTTLTPAEDIAAEGEYVYVAMRNGLMVVRALKPCPAVTCVDSGTLHVSTPAGLAPGTYHITLTDPNGTTTFLPDGFTIEANRPPVMEPLSNNPLIVAYEGETLTLTIRATDPDGDPLAYDVSLSRLPPGAHLSGNVFSWKPGPGDSGLYPDIRFQVSDGDFIVEQEVNFAVVGAGGTGNDPVVNTPPSLGTIGDKIVSEGTSLTFLIEAFDPDPKDSEDLTITMLGAPAGARLFTLPVATGNQDNQSNPSTAANKVRACFLWTPAYGQAGTYTITFKVRDQQLSDQKTVSIKVVAAPAQDRFELKAGSNIWACPAGRADYTSFAFLQELGAGAVYSLQAYDWDGTLLKSCFWLFGKPCGDDFPMDQSRIYRLQAKKDISFTWPRGAGL
jgi:hypothetical protein